MSNYQDLITKIESMTVVELNEFVKALEEKFGVSAAAMVAAVPAAGGAGDAAEVKTSFDVMLTGAGGQKVQVIKVIKDALGIGLMEAKAIVESAPKLVKGEMKKEEAEELKKRLEAAGATAELK
ncbi:MAG: 50S ribosomal protein L7/L12 [Parcubacteria group bacterium RIFCSPLOWO2_01_FULL_48_18]|nr:MAG: 50S ribosomal protein L7/L12 [Parcubacteria group bacterium RIFCSPLOWO2_01_FULL_48_18]